jgi:hypothetical protein
MAQATPERTREIAEQLVLDKWAGTDELADKTDQIQRSIDLGNAPMGEAKAIIGNLVAVQELAALNPQLVAECLDLYDVAAPAP